MNVLSILIICGFAYLMFVTWIFRRNGNGKSAGAGQKEKEKTPDAVEPPASVPEGVLLYFCARIK